MYKKGDDVKEFSGLKYRREDKPMFEQNDFDQLAEMVSKAVIF